LAAAEEAADLDALLDREGAKERVEIELADCPSPLAVVASREGQQRVRECLRSLPAVYREVLLLRFQEDLSFEEIAGIIRAPVSTVKSRLYRGLSAARELMEERSP
jgi:RNA polymerase sigma-70 factor, ECF subfamily